MTTTRPVFGSAHLFSLVDADDVDALLLAAWDAGFRDFDTAPSYGFGRSEVALGRLLATRLEEAATVTTKVGIAATPPPGAAKRAAKALARTLPNRVQDRLRGDIPPGGGRFDVGSVRGSVEESLRRLPRIDRLLLHEVQPDDVGPELLETLVPYVERGDIGRLGVATSPACTAPALARGDGRFDVVHHSVAPNVDAPPVGDAVRRVGHGAMGAGGTAVAALTSMRRNDPGWAARWESAINASGWSSDDAASVLLARAATLPGLDALIVATSRPERVADLHDAVTSARTLDPTVLALIDEACAAR